MSTTYYVMIGDRVMEDVDVPTTRSFDWEALREYVKREYGSRASIVSEYQLEAMDDDFEDDDFVSWEEIFS